jgi:hypothetical protein
MEVRTPSCAICSLRAEHTVDLWLLPRVAQTESRRLFRYIALTSLLFSPKTNSPTLYIPSFRRLALRAKVNNTDALSPDELLEDQPVVGIPCVARFTEDERYRSKILSVGDQVVTLAGCSFQLPVCLSLLWLFPCAAAMLIGK